MHNESPINTAHIGLGPIGIRVLEMASRIDRIEIVAAVDKADRLANSRIGDIIAVERFGDIRIEQDTVPALSGVRADVAVLATTSSVEALIIQMEPLMSARVNVVSTCEELMYPWHANPEHARTIDRMAKDAGVSVLGLGVNPGFVMEHLALFSTTTATDVRSVKVLRRVDLRTRRQQLRDKMAVGKSLADFEAARSKLGHIGLRESADLLAHRLGYKIDSFEHTLDPIMSEHTGKVAGLSEVIRGSDTSGRSISLKLQMSIEADDARDEIRVNGTPSLNIVIPGGVAGDDATAAITVNYIPAVLAAPAGLVTVDRLPAPGCFG